MKIVFLCSSLEPGRDGVGDYTRVLAQECVRQGHLCCAIALNDGWVSEVIKTDAEISILRLPASQTWAERIAQAQEALTWFAPDWVSLQFVPYGFHPKGLVNRLQHRLQPLTAGRKTHLMIHELWLGESRGAPLRHKALGVLQKFFILDIVRKIRAQVIHTSNWTYVRRLKQNGLAPHRLPLFGNVPLGKGNADDWLFTKLQAAGVKISPATRQNYWLGGFFGTIHPTWPHEPLFTLLQEAAARKGRRVVLLSAGRLGPGEELWDALAKSYAAQFHFCKLGERPAEEVSQYLSSVDFGIAVSPASLIGKSGSVAAMLDHGLPVIVNWDDTGQTLETPMPGDEALLHGIESLHDGAEFRRAVPRSRLREIAVAMLDDLTQ